MNKYIVLSKFARTRGQATAFLAALIIFTAPAISLVPRAYAEPAPVDDSFSQSQDAQQSTNAPPSSQKATTDQQQTNNRSASSDSTINTENSLATPSPYPVPTSMLGESVSNPDSSAINSGTIASLSNTLDALSQSGNVDVSSNTTVSDVTTGDATVTSTSTNMIQSNLTIAGSQQPILFSYDVTGSLVGNIVLDPALLSAQDTADPGLASGYRLDANPITVDSSTQAAIINTLNLSALSGNAGVSKNSNVGNILTGDANAVANVLNLVSSGIDANQVFIGSINIYGDLTGDILVPEKFVSTILGASQIPAGLLGDGADTIIVRDLSASIVNNITTDAISGNVIASNNSFTGNIASGNSKTNVTILNIVGQQITSDNALLVFVNILGAWTGLLLHASPGTTSATLAGAHSGAAPALPSPVSTDQHSTFAIENNINLSAQSGNATVTKNSQTGSIKTGNATASANIVNILNSRLSFSDWFGVLFINVFGTWKGNFAIAPDVATPTEPGQASSHNQQANDTLGASTVPRVIFAAANKQQQSGWNHGYEVGLRTNNTGDGAPTVSGKSIETVSKRIPDSSSKDGSSNLGFIQVGILLLLLVVGGAGIRYYSQR